MVRGLVRVVEGEDAVDDGRMRPSATAGNTSGTSAAQTSASSSGFRTLNVVPSRRSRRNDS